MELRCPYCPAHGSLPELHRHLLDAHSGLVTTSQDAASGKVAFALTCPWCEHTWNTPLRPRNRNPRFLQEFRAEITLVAFDQLLYHMLQRHPSELGADSGALQEL